MEVEPPHPGKMHEEHDMISIQPGEPTLTSEILHDDLHYGDIIFLKKLGRKQSLHLIYILSFDIGFIIVLI